LVNSSFEARYDATARIPYPPRIEIQNREQHVGAGIAGDLIADAVAGCPL
jgi:hypothetical protein